MRGDVREFAEEPELCYQGTLIVCVIAVSVEEKGIVGILAEIRIFCFESQSNGYIQSNEDEEIAKNQR